MGYEPVFSYINWEDKKTLLDSDIYTLADLEEKNAAVQATTKPEEIFTEHTDERITQIGEFFCLQNRELLYPQGICGGNRSTWDLNPAIYERL